MKITSKSKQNYNCGICDTEQAIRPNHPVLVLMLHSSLLSFIILLYHYPPPLLISPSYSLTCPHHRIPITKRKNNKWTNNSLLNEIPDFHLPLCEELLSELILKSLGSNFKIMFGFPPPLSHASEGEPLDFGET